MVTLTVPAALEVQPGTFAITEYVPVAAVVAPEIVGFCNVDVKLLGPVHEYVNPVVVAVSESVLPEHIGALVPAVGVAGGAFTVTLVVPFALKHPSADIAVTVYVPLLEVAAVLMTGF